MIAGTSNVAKFFVYDGGNVVLDFVDADGHLTGTATPVLDKRYFQAPGVDQLLAQENVTQNTSSPNRVWWVLPDHLGSTRDVVASTGGVIAHFQFDSFGVLLDGRENVTRYQFTGREHDSHTDLNYHRARWYDPLTGKWLSDDPIGLAAGDPNFTRYVGNRVLNATDPSGLYELVFRGNWSRQQQHQVEIVFALVLPVRVKRVLADFKKLRAAQIPCVQSELKDEWDRLEEVFTDVIDGLSGADVLYVRHGDYAKGVLAEIDAGWNILYVNDLYPWTNSDSFDDVVFHELTHLYGTQDDPMPLFLNNAHLLDDIYRDSVGAQILKNQIREALSVCCPPTLPITSYKKLNVTPRWDADAPSPPAGFPSIPWPYPPGAM